ncbi:MAG TPA: phosphoadenosine phosphosulfate reductase family protein, partial [Wenzhouxiangella sp.]|nr:phosphoadenosine phosphosulfate reductase family protein [Wenzhouxiangella sp.]
YNSRVGQGESVRVFPLSNWTEMDIWKYIQAENIAVVPLYFAAQRPVVERDGRLIVVDDDRMPLQPGERPEMRMVRFRTLGCWPLTAALESTASTVAEIIAETAQARFSERCGRLIDHDDGDSMEDKKIHGYF